MTTSSQHPARQQISTTSADSTIDTYTDDLNCYLAWLDENSFSLDEVSSEQI